MGFRETAPLSPGVLAQSKVAKTCHELINREEMTVIDCWAIMEESPQYPELHFTVTRDATVLQHLPEAAFVGQVKIIAECLY
jgi:hypothetical protein